MRQKFLSGQLPCGLAALAACVANAIESVARSLTRHARRAASSREKEANLAAKTKRYYRIRPNIGEGMETLANSVRMRRSLELCN